MSDKRISELVELTTLAADDELVVVDADANGTKRVTYDTLATDIRAETSTLNLGDSTAISRLGADTYRLISDVTANGLLTSWERADEPTSAGLGTPVTETNGTFNVQNNGVWLLLLSAEMITAPSSGDGDITIDLFIDGNRALRFFEGSHTSGTVVGSTLAGFYIGKLDATNDITLVSGSIAGNSFISGATDANKTYIIFVRLGDA